MASKLFRKIQPATPINYVGSLRYFDMSFGGKDLNVYALDFGSNRKWRRIEANLHKQVANLELWELFALIAPEHQWAIENDMYELESRKNYEYAIKQLKLYLVENHLLGQLVKLAVDFSIPPHKAAKLKIAALRKIYANKLLQESKTKVRLRRSYTFSSITPALLLTQESPNAPNTAPAFSLAAA